MNIPAKFDLTNINRDEMKLLQGGIFIIFVIVSGAEKYIRFTKSLTINKTCALQFYFVKKFMIDISGQSETYIYIYIFILLKCYIVCAGNPDAKRLYDDLLSNYNKLVRPVVNVTDALTVRIKLKLSQLIDVVRVSSYI